MPVPSSYTEDTLGLYMRDGVLKTIAGVLGLVNTSDFDEAVINALLGYGVGAIADASDIAKLRAWAAVAAWELAQTTAASDYRYSADGASFDRQQVFEHITTMLESARRNAAAVSAVSSDEGGLAVSQGTVAVPNQAVW